MNGPQTFLFADLAGYTALTEAHGDEQAADLAAEFTGCVRDLLARRDCAEEIKTIGDAVMVRDTRAADAIELGLEIVEAIDERERFPTVRVGMSTGDAVERGGDWFGSTVNLAARISAAAGGSEVLLSEATREAGGELAGVELHRHGQVRLRGVPEPVMLYRAVRTGESVGELPIDPVCKMKIEPGTSAGELTHAGVEYHFCSLGCAAEFARNPERYVG